MSLLPVAEAQARLLALAPPLPVETIALVEAAGRWASADVIARRTQPAADLSAMDGYAVRAVEAPGPWTVVGESAAGAGFVGALAPGEAVRIFTGAPLPAGADAVVIQENVAREGERIRFTGDKTSPGAHVRPAGSDFTAGRRLIAEGERLTPPRVALAAMGGHGALPVRRRPRVAILSTGDELVPPGDAIGTDRLPASNGPMLAALLAGRPVAVDDRSVVADELAALSRAFTAAAAVADIVVTTGGASVGDRDLVRPALLDSGAALDFWKVAMRPGKPLMAGRLGDAVVLGLPGNPVSAFVTATLFLLPLVRQLGGDPDPLPRPARMPLLAPLPAVGERADYLRGVRVAEGVRALGGQDSAALAMLAEADCLIVRPARAAAAAAGDMTDIISLA